MIDPEKYGEKLTELERKLYEQEHRPIVAIKNFFFVRPHLKEDDPLRRSIAFSVISAIFFSPSGVAAIGSLVALVSLIFLGTQTWHVRKQTEEFEEQNKQLRNQNSIMRNTYKDETLRVKRARRTELIEVLYEPMPSGLSASEEVKRSVDGEGKKLPKYDFRTRAEALEEYVSLERDLKDDPDHHSTAVSRYDADLSHSRLQFIDISRNDLKHTTLDHADMRGIDLKSSELSGATFKAADLRFAEFLNSYETPTTMKDVNLSKAKLDWANFDDVVFKSVNLRKTKLEFVFFNPHGEISISNKDRAKFTNCYISLAAKNYLESEGIPMLDCTFFSESEYEIRYKTWKEQRDRAYKVYLETIGNGEILDRLFESDLGRGYVP